MMMQKFFVFSSHVLLYFKEWQIDKTWLLIDAFIGIFLFTLLYEIANFYHSRKGKYTRLSSVNERLPSNQSDAATYGTFRSCADDSPVRRTAFFCAVCKGILFTRRYVLRSLFFAILVAANYFIMFAVMTYNAWLFIAVCLATGLAYFVLAPPEQARQLRRDFEGAHSSLLHSGDRHQEL